MIGYGLYLATLALSLVIYVFAAQIIARMSQVWPFCMPALGGIAAYTTAISSTTFQLNPALSLILGILAASLVGAVSGILLSRMSPDRASIATLAIQIGWTAVFLNWSTVTRGALGISGIPGLIEQSTTSQRAMCSIAILGLVTVLWLVARIRVSGTILASLEAAHFESPAFLSGAGWPVENSRALSWAAASALAGLSGGVWAQFVSFIDPATFGASGALLIVCIALLSGRSALLATGITVGFVAFPESLRRLGVSSASGAAAQQIAFGLFVACAVAWSINRSAIYDDR